jgi:hypothetical protein
VGPETHGIEGIYLPRHVVHVVVIVVVIVAVATLRMRGLDLVAAVSNVGVIGLFAEEVSRRLTFRSASRRGLS